MQSINIFMNNKRITAPTTTTHRRTAAASQACAACKYQRRKCAADCILAPYFPHDRQQRFLNAHRLFGVSNIVRIVRRLPPSQKDTAMRTIIFQSDARAADSVGGCLRIVRDLEHQIELATAELQIVLHHLSLCRAAAGDATVVEDDGINAWSCMDEMNVNVNDVHAESSPSSFNQLDYQDQDQDLNIILENLSRDDNDDEDGYNHQVLSSINDTIFLEEMATVKEEEEDGKFSHVEGEISELQSGAAAMQFHPHKL